jgi:hypothetical protein
MKTTNQRIPKTTDYSIFEMHPLNRPLRKNRDRLLASMKKYGFPPSCAIHVRHNGGKKLLVVRGHHRLEIAKELKLPVYYIIDDTPFDIFELEGDSALRWSLGDFLFARARAGDIECQKLISWIKKHDISVGAASALVGGYQARLGERGAANSSASSAIKRGSFTASTLDFANKVAIVTDYCREAGYPFATSSSFVVAISKAIQVENFDFERFMGKMANHGHKIKKRSTKEEYLEEIEMIYNAGHSKTRLNVAFLANELSRKSR